MNGLILPIITQRLYITKFDESMAESVHLLSLDDDNRRFVPDEVFETVDEAKKIINTITQFYSMKNAPLIYAIILNERHIGHVQAVPLDSGGFEIGYHIGKEYVNNGYATEAVKAFLPPIMKYLDISQIHGTCMADNISSRKVLEKCGFALVFEGEGSYHGNIKPICRYLWSKTSNFGN